MAEKFTRNVKDLGKSHQNINFHYKSNDVESQAMDRFDKIMSTARIVEKRRPQEASKKIFDLKVQKALRKKNSLINHFVR